MAITAATGNQYLLMGNQDLGGAGNPAIIRATNGNLEIGKGTAWVGPGGTFTSNVFLPTAVTSASAQPPPRKNWMWWETSTSQVPCIREVWLSPAPNGLIPPEEFIIAREMWGWGQLTHYPN